VEFLRPVRRKAWSTGHRTKAQRNPVGGAYKEHTGSLKPFVFRDLPSELTSQPCQIAQLAELYQANGGVRKRPKGRGIKTDKSRGIRNDKTRTSKDMKIKARKDLPKELLHLQASMKVDAAAHAREAVLQNHQRLAELEQLQTQMKSAVDCKFSWYMRKSACSRFVCRSTAAMQAAAKPAVSRRRKRPQRSIADSCLGQSGVAVEDGEARFHKTTVSKVCADLLRQFTMSSSPIPCAQVRLPSMSYEPLHQLRSKSQPAPASDDWSDVAKPSEWFAAGTSQPSPRLVGKERLQSLNNAPSVRFTFVV
jgi:hypothetical protein